MTIILIFSIILVFTGLISCLLPPGFSMLVYGITYIWAILLFVISIILLIINKQKKNFFKILLSVLITLFYLIFSHELYNLIHNYNETRKEMHQLFNNNFKIIGLSHKNIEDHEGIYCKNVFDVKLNDSSNITFQAGYCDVGTMWTNYDVIHNYNYYYIPYYYNLYKNNHYTTIKMEINDNNYFDSKIKFIYNYENIDEIYEFIMYLKEKMGKVDYQLFIYNESNNEEEILSSWFDLINFEKSNLY